MIKDYLHYITLAIGLVIGISFGSCFCQKQHLKEQATSISTETQTIPDSVNLTLNVKESATGKTKALTLDNGKKLIRQKFKTKDGVFDLDQTFDPKTDSVETQISYAAIYEVLYHYERIKEIVKIHTASVTEDSNGWTWAAVGGLIGSVITALIVFLIL